VNTQDNPRLQTIYESVYLPRQLVDATPSCRTQYERNLRYFDQFLGRPATTADLTDDNLSAFIRSIHAKGRSPVTANKIRGQIVAFWRFLARKGYVSVWPDVPKLKEHKRRPIAWTEEQLAKLFDACRRQRGSIGCLPANLWWTSLHNVLWDCGTRIGATLPLEWPQVDLEARTIVFLAETQKQKEDQVFRIREATAESLRAIYSTRRQRVWPFPYIREYLWALYKKVLIDAGLPTDRRSMFHRMRRSHASHLTRAGGDARKSLGHANAALTERCYIDPIIAGEKSAVDFLPRIDESERRPSRRKLPRAEVLYEVIFDNEEASDA
jgi:integrase